MMKTLSLLLVLAASAVSQASFELMYIPLANGRIQRYDPAERVQLGSILTPSPTTQVYYRGGTTGLVNMNVGAYYYDFVANYNTGYVGYLPTAVGADGTKMYRPTGSTVQALDVTTRSFTNTNLSGLTVGPFWATQDQNNNFYALQLNGSILTFSAHTSTGTIVNSVNATQGGGLNQISASSVHSNRQGNRVFVVPTRFGTVNALCMGQASTSGAFSATVITSGLAAFNASASLSVVPNHAGYYVIGQDAANTALTRIAQYDNDGFGVQMGTWTENFTISSTLTSVGMVVAPEPSSMLAFALGGLCLLRRRKQA